MDSACRHLFSYSVNLPPRHTGPPLSLPATPQVRYPGLLLSISSQYADLCSGGEERWIVPPTAPGSTTSLTLAGFALPLPAKTAPTSSRLRPPTRLPFRRLPSHPWWRLPWHPWSHHEGLRRDVQGDEEGELQPETQNILSRGEPASRTRTKSFGVARLIVISAFPPSA